MARSRKVGMILIKDWASSLLERWAVFCAVSVVLTGSSFQGIGNSDSMHRQYWQWWNWHIPDPVDT
jgi:hypothetical protein